MTNYSNPRMAATIENWPSGNRRVTATFEIEQHPKRGERVILATTKPGATRPEVQAWMKAKGASESMHPSSVHVLDEIPLLGSGKVNCVALAKALSDGGA